MEVLTAAAQQEIAPLAREHTVCTEAEVSLSQKSKTNINPFYPLSGRLHVGSPHLSGGGDAIEPRETAGMDSPVSGFLHGHGQRALLR